MTNFNEPNNYDKYGNPLSSTRPFVYEPTGGNGRVPFVMLGLLVLLGIVGGAMYFNAGHRTAADVAHAPPAISDTRPAPATMPTPAPADAPSPTRQ